MLCALVMAGCDVDGGLTVAETVDAGTDAAPHWKDCTLLPSGPSCRGEDAGLLRP